MHQLLRCVPPIPSWDEPQNLATHRTAPARVAVGKALDGIRPLALACHTASRGGGWGLAILHGLSFSLGVRQVMAVTLPLRAGHCGSTGAGGTPASHPGPRAGRRHAWGSHVR